jgi:subtilisin family serine protease
MKKLFLLSVAAAAMAISPSVISALADSAPSYPESQYHIPLSGFDRAWQVTEGSPEVKIAVIDTGVDLNHREFANTRFDPLSYNVNEGLVGIQHLMDDGGHGTQVIGVIAANNRDGEGVSGAAPNVTIMVIKANKVPANIYSPIRVAIGIRYAADNGAHIINLSMAAITTDTNIASAIEYAASKDVLVVAAAGNNSSGTPYYPGAFDNVIAVSSIDDQQNISGFSNHGAHIDIAAPGTRISTTRYSSHDASLDPYSRTNGTSFAAPQVAAALALVKSANPGMTWQQVRDRVLSTARDAGMAGFDNYYGHGILDVKAALGIQDPVQPSSSSSSETTTSSEQTSAPSSSEQTSSQPSSEPISSQPEEIRTWTVTFKVIRSVYRLEVVEDGQTVHVPPSPSIRFTRPISRMAIVFSGWVTESGQAFDFSSPITSDTVVVAKFRMVRIPTIIVRTPYEAD